MARPVSPLTSWGTFTWPTGTTTRSGGSRPTAWSRRWRVREALEAPTARVRRHRSGVQAAWRWTARVTSTSPTRTTTGSGRSRYRGRRRGLRQQLDRAVNSSFFGRERVVLDVGPDRIQPRLFGGDDDAEVPGTRHRRTRWPGEDVRPGSIPDNHVRGCARVRLRRHGRLGRASGPHHCRPARRSKPHVNSERERQRRRRASRRSAGLLLHGSDVAESGPDRTSGRRPVPVEHRPRQWIGHTDRS